MEDGGDHQLRTKCGKLLAEVGNKSMVSAHHIHQVLEAMPTGMEVIMLEDLNVRLREPWDDREDDLATALAGIGLTDVTAHFTPKRQCQGKENWTRQMRREGRTV